MDARLLHAGGRDLWYFWASPVAARYREVNHNVYVSGEDEIVIWFASFSPTGTTKFIWQRPGPVRPENKTIADLPPTVMLGLVQSPVPHAIMVSPLVAGTNPTLLGPTAL